jgi:hypothetical protein
MKPLLHAKISAKKFGGDPADYIDIHNWFDQTKAHIADARHRLVLHNAFGIFLCEQCFGDTVVLPNGATKKMPYITNSVGKQISVRDIAEQHVIDDLGHIPSLSDCFAGVSSVTEKTAGSARRLVISKSQPLNIVD